MPFNLFEFLERLKPGESVLIEYTSLDHPELMFYSSIKWISEQELPILIIDIFDALHVLREHLEIAGFDVSLIDNLDVIKGSGGIEVGRILGKLRVHEDIPVYIEEYKQLVSSFFKKVKSDFAFIFVIGIDKLLRIYESDPIALESYFENLSRKNIGRKRKISIVFSNCEILRKDTIKEWEELSTRVLEIREYGKALTIKKSPIIFEIGKKIEVIL